MEYIDSHLKAYLFGFYSASDKQTDVGCLDCPDEVCNKIRDIITNSEKNNVFLKLQDSDLSWTYIRGYYDNIGMSVDNNSVYLETPNESFCNDFVHFSYIPCKIVNSNKIQIDGVNVIDLFGELYKHKNIGQKLYKQYNYQLLRNHFLIPKSDVINNFNVYKSEPNAVTPSKTKLSDVGLDLTIIKILSKWNEKTSLYDTGIKISIPNGYYAEVVPRSSLSKKGYMLANSVGIIDPSYTGNICIALTKVCESVPDIELPFRCCQLIFKRQYYFEPCVVDEFDCSTSRGDGGFGSTN